MEGVDFNTVRKLMASLSRNARAGIKTAVLSDSALIFRIKLFEFSFDRQLDPFPFFIDGELRIENPFKSGEIFIGDRKIEPSKSLVAGVFDSLIATILSMEVREDLHPDLGTILLEKLESKSDRKHLGMGSFGGEIVRSLFDFHGEMGGDEFPLRKNPNEAVVGLEKIDGIPDGSCGMKRVREINREGPEFTKKEIFTELTLIHHDEEGFMRGESGNVINEETIPPVGMIRESKRRGVGIEIAKIFDSTTANGKKMISKTSSKESIKNPIGQITFLCSDHFKFP